MKKTTKTLSHRRKSSLTELVRALCLDFRRRDAAIKENTVSRRVRMEYVFLNTKLLEGAGEIIGGNFALPMILDIGDGVGYAASPLADFFSEAIYKIRKGEAVLNIARRLYLLD